MKSFNTQSLVRPLQNNTQATRDQVSVLGTYLSFAFVSQLFIDPSIKYLI